MATMSLDFVTTFMGLAKRHVWRTRSQSFRTSPLDLKMRLGFSKMRRHVRTFAATTTKSDNSDVLTKIPPNDPIPSTIITGFLGSGKTTLFNHMNVFGEVNIDGSLVATETTGVKDIVMLNNGCLYCTVNSDLIHVIS
uniref:CobW/HypB/UreG nucleotide-binding domain-containing protein n=1 Tax=Nelumbo nucifera TaxID=4432 RepID=A0A822ZKM9_NELNU|nr:TPA_asm: hypothetical protein HUJ06_003300 [Nelumbo nucifera]